MSDLDDIRLHFEMCFVIGDTSGHDLLCGHYKAYGKESVVPCAPAL